jgi:hypothetical protein
MRAAFPVSYMEASKGPKLSHMQTIFDQYGYWFLLGMDVKRRNRLKKRVVLLWFRHGKSFALLGVTLFPCILFSVVL